MRFSTAAALALLFYAGAVMAQDVGESCPADQAGFLDCGYAAWVNGGNAYIFMCNGEEFVLLVDCATPTGCQTEGPWTARCTTG